MREIVYDEKNRTGTGVETIDITFNRDGDCSFGELNAMYKGKSVGFVKFDQSTYGDMLILKMLHVSQFYRNKGIANKMISEICRIIRTECTQYDRLWGDVRRSEALLTINKHFGPPKEIFYDGEYKTVEETLKILPGRRKKRKKISPVYVEWSTKTCKEAK